MSNMQRHIGVHMSEAEYAQCDSAEAAFQSPVPTQVVSNGEYNPLPQTEAQAKVEALIKEMADVQAKRHGVDRRRFLQTSAGMATAFVAMNKVFGPVFDVSEAEAHDIEMSDYRAKQLSNQFIFDDQTHFIRDDFKQEGLLGLTKWAVGAKVNPRINDAPMTLARYKMDNYLKEIFLDSDTKPAAPACWATPSSRRNTPAGWMRSIVASKPCIPAAGSPTPSAIRSVRPSTPGASTTRS
jgi:hypothetical protein